MFKRDIDKKFPILFLITILLSLYLSSILSNPLDGLKEFFVDKHFIFSSFLYILFIFLSVLFYPITILPVIPFFSRIFTPFYAFIFTLLGMVLGTLVSFYIARYKTEHFLNKFFSKERIDEISKKFPRNLNFIEILFFKFSSTPKGFSYFVGKFTKIKAFKYFLASFLGALPLIYILSYSDDAIVNEKDRIIEFFFLLVSIFLVLFSHIYYNFLFKKNKAIIVSNCKTFDISNIFSVATIELFFEKKGANYDLFLTTNDSDIAKYKKYKIKGKKVIMIDVGWELNIDNDFFDIKDAEEKHSLDTGKTIFSYVWKKYGEKLTGSRKISAEIMKNIGENILFYERKHQKHFNKYGKLRIDLEYIIRSFNSESDDNDVRKREFNKAVKWAKNFIKSEIKKEFLKNKK